MKPRPRSFGCNRNALSIPNSIFLFALITALFFSSCKKDISTTEDEIPGSAANSGDAEENIVDSYDGLLWQTQWELQQARAATARYRKIENAIKDGYADINVVVEEMGHHYLKSTLVDGNFDYRKPEILVYNKEHNGSMRLVAVEYAVPLTMSADAPAGFTGDDDVWDRNTGFGLWLLHAWVWEFNPEGVFNPTNPNVHLH